MSSMWLWQRRLSVRVIFVACGLLCAVSAIAGANVEPKRLALVMGNDAYQNVHKLERAGNDAGAIASELKAAGFEVTLARDLNYRNMVKQVDFFTSHITGGDQVVIFFAGHGVQLKSGSYLLPTDIEANSESEIEKTAISLNEIMDRLNDAKASFSLVMVDACRDNPLKSNGRALGAGRGLLPPDPPKGQMVVYSASKGQQALDKLSEKDSSPNGVFTREFIARMRQPGVRIEDLVRNVQDAVESLAKSIGHDQRPALYNEARGDFYFYGQSKVEVVVPPPVAYSPAEKSTAVIDDEAWDSVKDSADLDLLNEYLVQFPTGRHIGQARIAMAKVKSEMKRAGKALPTVAATVALPVPGASVVPGKPGVVPAKASPGQALTGCSACMEMVEIPAGDFVMGNGEKGKGLAMRMFSTVTRYGKSADKEKPAHAVKLARFAIGKTPVTQGQWIAIMGTNPSESPNCGLECPVDMVSWNDVKEYIKKLNATTGLVYRLPSESEWEYACRAGSDQTFCGGDEAGAVGWFKENSGKELHQVATKKPNAFGLFDMSGNVRQWVEDAYHSDYVEAPADGSAWLILDDDTPKRVVRGGAWSDDQGSLRAVGRNRDSMDSRQSGTGFRLARSLAP